jgi:hypothetical protein
MAPPFTKRADAARAVLVRYGGGVATNTTSIDDSFRCSAKVVIRSLCLGLALCDPNGLHR